MDRSLANPLPDLTNVDDELVPASAGRESVLQQVEYFRENFGLAQSRWKKDGTRVTDVDEAISQRFFPFFLQSSLKMITARKNLLIRLNRSH